jgi:phosphoglycolate phosphatase
MWKNIILDWSGTVVDDLSFVWESTNHVLTRFGKPAITREIFRERFTLPWIEFYNEHLSEIPREEINRVFWERMKEAQVKIPLFPDAMDFFLYCRSQHLPIFILSTVDSESFWGQSNRLGTTPLIRKAYVGVEDKREVIGKILEENQLDPSETIMVGDMIHDIHAAREAGVTACSVLSGFDPYTKLVKAGPDLILRDLSELRIVLHAQQMMIGKFPIATVGVLIFNSQAEVLMLRTAKWSGKWGIPGGKIRQGETMEEAARREILEEVNLELDEVRFETVEDCVNPPEFFKRAHFILINFSARARSESVRLNDEAQDWKWVMPEDALRMDLNRPSRALIEHYLDRTACELKR